MILLQLLHFLFQSKYNNNNSNNNNNNRRKRVFTIYKNVGYLFQHIIMILSLFFIIWAYLPDKYNNQLLLLSPSSDYQTIPLTVIRDNN